jgi:tetratricopeptide (TPR) repeat protein
MRVKVCLKLGDGPNTDLTFCSRDVFCACTISPAHQRVGDYMRHTEYTELTLDLARKINHPVYQIRSLRSRGDTATRHGRHYESIRDYRAARKIARLNGLIQEECVPLAWEAIALCRVGDFTAAQACAVEAELLLKKGFEGSDMHLSILDAEVEINLHKSEYSAARELTERMVKMTSRHRSPYFHAYSVMNLVLLDLITGLEDTLVLENLASARQLATELRFDDATQMCDFCQAKLDFRNGDAIKAYTKFQIWGGRAELQHDVSYLSLETLGELSNNLCGLEKTFHWATTYFALSRKGKHIGHAYQALRYLGDISLAKGDETTAMNIFLAVLEASTEMDVHRRRADCMSRMGDIFHRRGEAEKAKDMWEAALPLFVRSSQASDAAAIDVKLAQLARGDVDAHSEISVKDATPESPAQLLNLRAPSDQPVVKSEGREMVAMVAETVKVAGTG